MVCGFDGRGSILCSSVAVFGFVGADGVGEIVAGAAEGAVEPGWVQGAKDPDGEDTDGDWEGVAHDSVVSNAVCGSSECYFLVLGDYVCAERCE